MPEKDFVATMFIGGGGGFVCPFTRILVDRELVTLRPPLAVRWLVRTRKVAASDTKVVNFGFSSVVLEKRNGMVYRFQSSEADAMMSAFRDAGFPMVGA